MNENRVYTIGHTPQRNMYMSKKINAKLSSFGKRLAQLRKAAGYTQQQLADEINATRRMIAYYESESQHPPANMLVDLAKALNISSDALLGIEPIESTPISSRLERRIRQIEKLGPKPRQQITQLIDTFVEAEQLKQKISAT
jgi:transcriptional regulator with XRE-family HTH domain